MDVIYVIAPILLIAIVLAAVWLDRWSVPVILIALGAGILFGSDVLKLLYFDDIQLANRFANLALVFILFHGGFSTKKSDFKAVAFPAGGLATWGVILTALATFGVLHGLFNWPLEISLLLAAIISSTDAAAIFSILRRQSLPPRVSSTLEIESAANDPMAILLTAVIGHHYRPVFLQTTVALFIWKFTAAPVFGWFLARVSLWLFNSLRTQDRGHYYVLSLGIILLIRGFRDDERQRSARGVRRRLPDGQPPVHPQARRGQLLIRTLHGRQRLHVRLDGAPGVSSPVGGALARRHPARSDLLWRPCGMVGNSGHAFRMEEKTFISWAGLSSVPIVLATYPSAAGLDSGRTSSTSCSLPCCCPSQYKLFAGLPGAAAQPHGTRAAHASACWLVTMAPAMTSW